MSQVIPIPRERSPRLTCAQVYGGTQATRIPIEMPGVDGFLYSQPCLGHVGGDIHYVSICGSGLLSRFCLADVVGHGADVAIVSKETHALLRKAVNWTDHRRVLRQLNRALTDRGLGSLTTAAMFTYFPPTRNLSFSYAGHPPAWHWSAARAEWSRLNVPSQDAGQDQINDIPLAVSPDTDYTRSRARIGVGDMIVVTTDGVTDALDDSAQRFGEERFSDTLMSVRPTDPKGVVESVVQRLAEFCGSDTFDHDDVTVLAVRMNRFSTFSALRLMMANRLLRPLVRRRRR